MDDKTAVALLTAAINVRRCLQLAVTGHGDPTTYGDPQARAKKAIRDFDAVVLMLQMRG